MIIEGYLGFNLLSVEILNKSLDHLDIVLLYLNFRLVCLLHP